MIKKILSSSLAALLMTSSVGFSYATKEPEFPELIKKNLSSYVFYEDFEKYADGDAPLGMTLFNSSSVSKTEVAVTNTPGGEKGKTLLISDNDTEGNSAVTLRIPTTEKSATVEFKLKAAQSDESALPAYIQLKNSSGIAAQVAITKLGELYYNGEEKNYPIGNRRMIKNEWYTVKLRLDYEKQTIDIYLSGEQLKGDNYTANTEFRLDKKKGQMLASGLPLKSGAKGTAADTLYIVTSGNTYTGNIWMDDIGVTHNQESIPFDMEKPPKIIPATVEAPKMRLLQGKQNLLIDGKYFYFSAQPYYYGESLMVKYTDASRALRLLYWVKGDKITLSSSENTVVLNKNSAVIKLNGNEKKLSAAVTSEGFIPFKDVAQLCGYSLKKENDVLMLEGSVK